jgi:hypothetical protein
MHVVGKRSHWAVASEAMCDVTETLLGFSIDVLVCFEDRMKDNYV